MTIQMHWTMFSWARKNNLPGFQEDLNPTNAERQSAIDAFKRSAPTFRVIDHEKIVRKTGIDKLYS